MKHSPFSLEQLGKPKTPAKTVPKAVTKPTKPTKHGQEINRLLKRLSKFEWDLEAMKRV